MSTLSFSRNLLHLSVTELSPSRALSPSAGDACQLRSPHWLWKISGLILFRTVRIKEGPYALFSWLVSGHCRPAPKTLESLGPSPCLQQPQCDNAVKKRRTSAPYGTFKRATLSQSSARGSTWPVALFSTAQPNIRNWVNSCRRG